MARRSSEQPSTDPLPLSRDIYIDPRRMVEQIIAPELMDTEEVQVSCAPAAEIPLVPRDRSEIPWAELQLIRVAGQAAWWRKLLRHNKHDTHS